MTSRSRPRLGARWRSRMPSSMAWATLERVDARRASDVEAIRECFAQRLVAVYVGPFETLVTVFKPVLLVDARMRERAVPVNQRGLATATVGLGPNFKVG